MDNNEVIQCKECTYFYPYGRPDLECGFCNAQYMVLGREHYCNAKKDGELIGRKIRRLYNDPGAV